MHHFTFYEMDSNTLNTIFLEEVKVEDSWVAAGRRDTEVKPRLCFPLEMVQVPSTAQECTNLCLILTSSLVGSVCDRAGDSVQIYACVHICD